MNVCKYFIYPIMEQDIKRQIDNFYNNKRHLYLTHKYASETFFDVLGNSRSEISHSNFLKWFFLQHEWNEESLRQLIKIYISKANENQKQALLPLIDIEFHLDNCAIEIHSASTEKICYFKVGNKTQNGRIDLVITSTLRHYNQVVPVKVVIENKIDSSEHDSQTKKYYTYFANSDKYGNEQILSLKKKGKYVRDKYKFQRDEYRGADINAQEIILYIYLSLEANNREANNEEGAKDNICEDFIKITYQDIYDNIFRQLSQEILNGKYTGRNASYFNEYVSNLLRPVINQSKNHIAMCYDKQDAEKLREFFYSNLPLFKLASETVFRTSNDESEKKAISEIYKGISNLTKDYNIYSNNKINNQNMSNSNEIPSLEEYLQEEEEQEKALMAEEVAKVERKVPKWLNNPHQINSQILQLFMTLSKNNEMVIKRDELQTEFERDHRDPFYSNYVQMKNFGPKNHAKVFEEDSWGNIRLWKPVADFIVGLYESKQQ